MPVTIRAIQMRTSMLRPVPMPSVVCPIVRDWQSGSAGPDWVGINHCNTCAHVMELHINYETQTGEVHCAAR